MKKLIQLVCLLGIGTSLAACSNGLQSKGVSLASNPGQDTLGGGGTPTQPEDIQIDTKAVEEAAADAEQALVEAEAAISDLLDANGNIKIFSLGASSAEAEVEAQFIADKLEEVLGRVLEKLQIVPQTFDKARSKLTDAMSKLDPTNPAHQAAIDKIMMLMEKLDQLQARVRTVTAMVADKIDFVMDKVDALLARLGSNPLTAILLFEVERVKMVIENFKQSLLTL